MNVEQCFPPSSATPPPRSTYPAPGFQTPLGATRALEDYRGGWLLLLFYPRDFSLVCPTELIGLSQRFEEFEQAPLPDPGRQLRSG